MLAEIALVGGATPGMRRRPWCQELCSRLPPLSIWTCVASASQDWRYGDPPPDCLQAGLAALAAGELDIPYRPIDALAPLCGGPTPPNLRAAGCTIDTGVGGIPYIASDVPQNYQQTVLHHELAHAGRCNHH
jgi:hypothetical protein